jgi:hypothetical protein
MGDLHAEEPGVVPTEGEDDSWLALDSDASTFLSRLCGGIGLLANPEVNYAKLGSQLLFHLWNSCKGALMGTRPGRDEFSE